jgi:hypothetical protein
MRRSEDETVRERHEIPMLEYETLSMEVVDEMQLATDKEYYRLKNMLRKFKFNHFGEEEEFL